MQDASQELPDWDYAAAVEEAEPVVWRYLSKSAVLLGGIDSHELQPLRTTDLRRLVGCHLVAHATANGLLDVVERLQKELPASVSRRRDTYYGHIRGRVAWSRTVQRRAATADPTAFVCEPVDRRYDTPLGRLIKLTLHCLGQLQTVAGIQPRRDGEPLGHLGQCAAELGKTSRRLAKGPKLRQVRLVERNLLRHLDDTVARFPASRELVEFVDLFYRGISLVDPAALGELLRKQIFVPGSEDKLFELIVGLRLLEAVESCGYELAAPLAILPSSGAPFAELHSEHSTCQLWWQRSHWAVLPVASSLGRWSRVLSANQITDARPLMPDFVVDLPTENRTLLVEVKLSTVGAQRERDGLRDVLAYLTDIETAAPQAREVQALVVAWNATGQPRDFGSTVMVTSQTRLKDTMKAILKAPKASKSPHSLTPA